MVAGAQGSSAMEGGISLSHHYVCAGDRVSRLHLSPHLLPQGPHDQIPSLPSHPTPSKRDIELLLKLIANLNMLLRDENVNVVKKAILTMTQLYKVALQVRIGWAFQKQLKPHQNWVWFVASC